MASRPLRKALYAGATSETGTDRVGDRRERDEAAEHERARRVLEVALRQLTRALYEDSSARRAHAWRSSFVPATSSTTPPPPAASIRVARSTVSSRAKPRVGMGLRRAPDLRLGGFQAVQRRLRRGWNRDSAAFTPGGVPTPRALPWPPLGSSRCAGRAAGPGGLRRETRAAVPLRLVVGRRVLERARLTAASGHRRGPLDRSRRAGFSAVAERARRARPRKRERRPSRLSLAAAGSAPAVRQLVLAAPCVNLSPLAQTLLLVARRSARRFDMRALSSRSTSRSFAIAWSDTTAVR